MPWPPFPQHPRGDPRKKKKAEKNDLANMQCSPANAALLTKLVKYIDESPDVLLELNGLGRESLAELQKFLFLVASYPTEALSPGRLIDAAWQTHSNHPTTQPPPTGC